MLCLRSAGALGAPLSGALAAEPTQNFHPPLGARWCAHRAHDGSTPATGVVDQTRRKRADLLRRLASLLALALRSPPAASGPRRLDAVGHLEVFESYRCHMLLLISVRLCGPGGWLMGGFPGSRDET